VERGQSEGLRFVSKVLIIDGSKTCINKLISVENEGVGLTIRLLGHPL
jgi:hypothetical protein